MGKLPDFLQPCLASYDLNKLSMSKDKKLIITSILNKGDDKALNWLIKTYSKKEIKEVIRKPLRGFWHESILKYWLKIFDKNFFWKKVKIEILEKVKEYQLTMMK